MISLYYFRKFGNLRRKKKHYGFPIRGVNPSIPPPSVRNLAKSRGGYTGYFGSICSENGPQIADFPSSKRDFRKNFPPPAAKSL